MPFSQLKLHPSLLQGLKDLGFTTPTPIQTDAIPPALEGKDLLACAMTGSGKTIAKIAGAAGGAFVGNKVEQKARATTHYDITVHLDTGTDTVVSQATQPTLGVGAPVRIVNGAVVSK